ncbi:zinc finger, CCHC-type containing protein [Tanacetum coccineum]
MAAAMKHMASNFAKLDKFEGVDFRRWQKKMHFLLSSMSVVYVLTTLMPEDGGDNPTMEQVRKRAKWDNDDYVCRCLILNGMSDSLFDIYQNVDTFKELWDTLEAKYIAEDASSKKFFDNDKLKGNNVVGPLVVNMVEHNNSSRYNDNRGKRKHHDTKADPNKESKVICWKIMMLHGGLTQEQLYICVKIDGSILHMGNESTVLVHGRGCIDLRLGHIHFKRMQDMSKDGLIPAFDMDIKNDLYDLHATPSLGNKKYFATFIYDASRFCYVYLLHSNDEALDKFKVFKTKVELQQGSLIKKIRTDRGGPSQELWGEAMLTACYLLNRVPNKRNRMTPYELWTKRKPNLNYLRVWGCRAVIRLSDPKLKTLGERGIECIFVGYAEHSKAFRFFIIKPNESVSINSIIESRDVIFDENRFSSVPRPSQRSLKDETEDIRSSVVPEKVIEEVVQQPEPELRKSKRNRTLKSFGPKFQLYLIEGTRDLISDQHSYCFNVEDDPKIFDEVMKSQDVFFWKESINNEMDSIMGNNTWVLADLPLGIDYFDTYALVARISTIRLLIAMASIHSLIIHQMDMKTAFLNGELEEEVYMNQCQGFIMPENENKVWKLIKSLYRLEHAPKQWHQKIDEVVLSNGYLLNQADKCVYSKFDESGKGDMGEVDVILGIRIKHESNGIAISQSHYIEKVLKKFNYFDCTPVSTPMDISEKLMPNNSQDVSQLEYFRVIGCLMYAMTCTRPDIAFVVVLEGYTNVSWISNTEDNSSTTGWAFLLGGGAISWASKKQTCITGSTMEFEFVALAAAGKDAECVATLAKAYSQMYNVKSRHLGVSHSMIRELITNGEVSIEFVRSQQNLADHLTKGLARDLVIKSVEGMGLKMYLEPAEKEDEIVNFLMVNVFEKVLSRSMNK